MTTATCFTTVRSPIGTLLLLSDGRALTALYPESHRAIPIRTMSWRRDDAWFSGVRDQLKAYFDGRLTDFDVPLAPVGTDFQRATWAYLRLIRCGETMTYGDLARKMDRPSGARAVGLAAGRNPISLIVPCHRVLGSDGSLTGYAGGVEMKRWLLEHELTRFGARPFAGSFGLMPSVPQARAALA